MVKILSDGYGLTNDAAMWAVVSWCQMLKLGEVAETIEQSLQIFPNTPSQPSNNQTKVGNATDIGLGVYKAGVDFPSGELRLKANPTAKLNIFYGISKNPNKIDTNKSFLGQTYITIQDGQFLKLECFDTKTKYTITVTLM